MSTSPVVIRGLARRFGKQDVLKSVDLEVPEGSVTALLGRNAAGKSTLLRILVGLLPPTGGDARVLGLDSARNGVAIRRRVGFVPERLELARWMRVRDALRLVAPFRPTWNEWEARRLTEQLELDPSAKVSTLSKGSRTKLSLVLALAHGPSLLLLDEPFSGLDPVVRAEVLSAVIGHLRRDGRTVLLASHSMADVERVADRIAILDDGRIRLAGDLESIARRSHRFVVSLAGDADSWVPPGNPFVERREREAVVTYVDDDGTHEIELRNDPRVLHVDALGADLSHLFVATVKRPLEKERA